MREGGGGVTAFIFALSTCGQLQTPLSQSNTSLVGNNRDGQPELVDTTQILEVDY